MELTYAKQSRYLDVLAPFLAARMMKQQRGAREETLTRRMTKGRRHEVNRNVDFRENETSDFITSCIITLALVS